MTIIGKDFCGQRLQPLLDTNLIWLTDRPYLSTCFVNTVLIWIPCAIFWFLLPFEMYCLIKTRRDTKLKPHCLFVIRISSLFVLLSVILFRMGRNMIINFKNELSPAILFSHSFLIMTIVLAIFLTFSQRKRAILSYSIQWWTFFCFCLCNLLQLISGILLILHNDDAKDESVDKIDFGVSVAQFAISSICFILFSISVPITAIENLEFVQHGWPEYLTPFPSQLLFCWLNGLLWRGFRKGLELKSLWSIAHLESTAAAYSILKKNLDKEFGTGSKKPKKLATASTMAKILFCSFWAPLGGSAILKLFYDLLTYVGPICVTLLMNFQADSTEPQWHGYVYIVFLVGSQIIRSWALQHHYHRMNKLGVRIRAGIVAAIYRKALNLNNEVRKGASVGEIVNLMSVDATRFIEVAPYFHLIWSAPLQLALGLYFLYVAVGLSFLSGVGVFLIIFCMNLSVSGFYKKFQEVQMAKKDTRLKLLTEVLNGIRVIKFYAWELAFQKQIENVREEEMKCLRKSGYLSGADEIAWTCTNLFACLAIFATYISVSDNKVLRAQDAFIVVTIFNVMNIPLTILPMVISNLIRLNVTLKRLSKFFSEDDLEEYLQCQKPSEFALQLTNASFRWDKNSKNILFGLNLNVERGKLIAIVGPVGSGKSSLLSAFCGEMYKVSGSIFVNDTVAYVPQQAWVQNMTVRENILFANNYDSIRYKSVVESCALQPDFELLAGGDSAEIGERGINLSGGQKQRISLARAIYQNAEIYLLDDPLSAVDVHVGKHIFEEAIGPKGLLKDKTRILVTHGINFLPRCDLIVVIKDGKFQEIGKYRNLVKSGGVFAELLEQYFQKVNSKEIKDLKHLTLNKLLAKSKEARTLFDKDNDTTNEHKTSLSNTESAPFTDKHKSLANGAQVNIGRLIEEEEVKVKAVSWSVYWMYAKAGGCALFFHVFFLLLTQATFLAASIWLEIWTDKNHHYSIGLGLYGAAAIVLLFTTTIYSIAYVCFQIRAARLLHNTLMTKIFRAPMSFFDTTPTGRIINRCGKDINTVDNQIPMSLSQVASFILLFLQSLIAVIYATPIYVVPFVPTMIVYFLLQKLYVDSSRQLRRMEAKSRSPIYSHFQESILGVASIRAYHQGLRFSSKSDQLVDINNGAQMTLLSASSWLGIYLDVIGATMLGVATILTVVQRSSLMTGEVGLSITFALALNDLLHWGVQEIGVLETEIVAMERVKEYTKIESEAEWTNDYVKALKNWPNKGTVEFRNYITRYRPSLPLVLNKFNCFVKGEEKVGVVGRTGAGKSSLSMALFRLIEPTFGNIFIDNVDIGLLGLHDLRKHLTIIPQDPVLFSGTLRFNIDPFKEQSDADLWRVLELSHLKSFIASLPQKLSHEIAEGGANLSVGQRQLICLARALLRKSKVLVLDEATAAVDVETDALIQNTIKKQFKDCTVITIAHRLNTIIDSERIMVLNKGRLVEFESPLNLLKNPLSIFAQMATDANFSTVSDKSG